MAECCSQPRVSPMECMTAAEPPPTDHGTVAGSVAATKAETERVEPKHALLGAPNAWQRRGFVGRGRPRGARIAEAMPAPKGMTPAQWGRHCITNWPYRDTCPWCVASRRPNTQHRRPPTSERVSPLLVAEMCFRKGDTYPGHDNVLVMLF